MTTSLAHRGPDAQGTYRDGPVGLGHRRLSILDLSSNANQPFHSRDGRYCTAFNGEIYNFREVARELELQCRTDSDTEVITEAWARLGPACLDRFRGMFAAGIWDRQLQVLHLFRDRLGIKPLYYSWDGRRLLFASELKALRVPELAQHYALNSQALRDFLEVSFIPAPHSIFRSVYKLPAGHRAELSREGLRLCEYWRLSDCLQSGFETSKQAALDGVERILSDSIKEHLVADVPLGSFLSGGTDSSLVTALAQRQCQGRLRTFCINIEESDFSEAHYARQVADHLGTDHTEFRFSQREALELLADMTQVYDEPYADSSAAPTMLLSRVTRREVTVALSGDGGDELFLGYGCYPWARRLRQPLLWKLRKLLSLLLGRGSDRWRRIGDLVNAPERADLARHIHSQEQYSFSSVEVDRLLRLEGSFTPVPSVEQFPRRLDPAELQALWDLRHYLPDDLLVKVDRASMRYGLEVRVPLLDHRLVEYALNLSPDLKMRGSSMKLLLRELLGRYLPRPLVERRKWGFGLPLHKWLKGPLAAMEHEYLKPDLVERFGVVSGPGVQTLRRRFHAGQTRLYRRIWQLILLHKWLYENSQSLKL